MRHFLYLQPPRDTRTAFTPISHLRQRRPRAPVVCSGSGSRKWRGRLTADPHSRFLLCCTAPVSVQPALGAFWFTGTAPTASLLLLPLKHKADICHKLPKLRPCSPCFKGKSRCPCRNTPWPSPCPPRHLVSQRPSGTPGSLWLY